MKYLKKYEEVGPPIDNPAPVDPSKDRDQKNNSRLTKEFADQIGETTAGKITNKLRSCVDRGNLSDFIYLIKVEIPEYMKGTKSKSLSPERFPLEYVVMKGKLQFLNYLVGNLKVKLIRIDDDFLEGGKNFTRDQMIENWTNRPEPLLRIAIENNQKETLKYLLSHGLTNRLNELVYYVNNNKDIFDKKSWINIIDPFINITQNE